MNRLPLFIRSIFVIHPGQTLHPATDLYKISSTFQVAMSEWWEMPGYPALFRR